MDERKGLDLVLLLKSLIALCFAALLLSGCATCKPYIGSGQCHHFDWIPDHYEGECFVPGHFMCYKGTSTCIGPFKEGYWKRCGYWKSGYYPCFGCWQNWNRCLEQQCGLCRNPYSFPRACNHIWPRWLPWNWGMWHRSYRPSYHAYPAHAYHYGHRPNWLGWKPFWRRGHC